MIGRGVVGGEATRPFAASGEPIRNADDGLDVGGGDGTVDAGEAVDCLSNGDGEPPFVSPGDGKGDVIVGNLGAGC